MTITYGDRMLAAAEARARKRAAKRRRLVLMGPSVAIVLWAMTDLIVARHARLLDDGAGIIRATSDQFIVIGWTIAFVVVPLLMALKPDPLPSGAALAVLAGPALSPMLFGTGGWHLWQTSVLLVVALLVLAAARERRASA